MSMLNDDMSISKKVHDVHMEEEDLDKDLAGIISEIEAAGLSLGDRLDSHLRRRHDLVVFRTTSALVDPLINEIKQQAEFYVDLEEEQTRLKEEHTRIMEQKSANEAQFARVLDMKNKTRERMKRCRDVIMDHGLELKLSEDIQAMLDEEQ